MSWMDAIHRFSALEFKPHNILVLASLTSFVSFSIFVAFALPQKKATKIAASNNKLKHYENLKGQSISLPQADKLTEDQVQDLVTQGHMLSTKLRKIEQTHAERTRTIEVQKKEILRSQGRVEKEMQLQREAEAQFEIMQGTVLRLIEENKKQGMRRVILEDEKKKLEGDLRALVLHTGSQDHDISLQLASIFTMREQINEQKGKIKEENNNLVRERTRAQNQSALLNNKLNELKKKHSDLQFRTKPKPQESIELHLDSEDEDSVYYSLSEETNSLLDSLESEDEDDFGRRSLHQDWGLDQQEHP